MAYSFCTRRHLTNTKIRLDSVEEDLKELGVRNWRLIASSWTENSGQFCTAGKRRERRRRRRRKRRRRKRRRRRR